MKKRRLLALEVMDRVMAVVGLCIAVLMIVYNILYLNSIITYYIFLIILILCLLYLIIGDQWSIALHDYPSKKVVFSFSILFFLLYIGSLLLLYMRPYLYERPLGYFILIILMSGALAGSCIRADRRDVPLIFLQIFLLAMNLGWSHLMMVPGLVGIDPWYHYGMTSRIIDTFFIPENYHYKDQPIFHLIIAIFSIISTLSYKFSAMLSVSLAQIICNTTMVFLFANYLFKNHRIALLAALLIILGDVHIRWLSMPVPNAFGGIFVLIVIYFLFSKYNPFSRISTIVVLVTFMSTIILTHTLVSAVMVIMLFMYYGSFSYRELISGNTEVIKTLLIPCFYTLAMFGYWIYWTNIIRLFSFFLHDLSLEFISFKEELSSTVTISQLESIFPFLGNYLFFSLAMVGILYMVSKKGSNKSFTMAFLSLTLILIPFVFYLSGKMILQERFTYFAITFLSIPLAISIYLLGTHKAKTDARKYGFIIGSVMVLGFLSVMSVSGCADNHHFAPLTGSKMYYTPSELSGSDFFGHHAVGVISSDFHHGYNPSSSLFVHVYNFDHKYMDNLDLSFHSGEFMYDESVKIVRQGHFRDFRRKGFVSSIISDDIDSHLSNLFFDKIYDNDEVSGYTGGSIDTP